MSNKTLKYIKFILYFLLAAAIIYLIIKLPRGKKYSVEEIVAYINTNSKFAVLSFCLIYSVKIFMLAIPVSFVNIAAGIIFTPIQAVLVNLAGIFLELTVPFILGRFFGQSFVEKIASKKKGKRKFNLDIDIKEKAHSFKSVLIMRLIPIFPVDFVSAFLGTTNSCYKKYIASSMLGLMPRTVCYSFIGNGIYDHSSLKFIVPVLAAICVSAIPIIIYAYRDFNKIKDEHILKNIIK